MCIYAHTHTHTHTQIPSLHSLANKSRRHHITQLRWFTFRACSCIRVCACARECVCGLHIKHIHIYVCIHTHINTHIHPASVVLRARDAITLLSPGYTCVCVCVCVRMSDLLHTQHIPSLLNIANKSRRHHITQPRVYPAGCHRSNTGLFRSHIKRLALLWVVEVVAYVHIGCLCSDCRL